MDSDKVIMFEFSFIPVLVCCVIFYIGYRVGKNFMINREDVRDYTKLAKNFTSAMFMRYIYDKLDIVKTEGKLIKISYLYNNEKYIIVIPRVTGYKELEDYKFINGEEDITEKLRPYMGPNSDFHGMSYTPKMLGYDSVTIKYNNNEVSYGDDEFFVENGRIDGINDVDRTTEDNRDRTED